MWFHSFLKNHKDLQLLKPRQLNIAREKCASAAAISKYYKELSIVLTQNNLHDKPHLIFIVSSGFCDLQTSKNDFQGNFENLPYWTIQFLNILLLIRKPLPNS
jgi:hypothetical protein